MGLSFSLLCCPSLPLPSPVTENALVVSIVLIEAGRGSPALLVEVSLRRSLTYVLDPSTFWFVLFKCGERGHPKTLVPYGEETACPPRTGIISARTCL